MIKKNILILPVLIAATQAFGLGPREIANKAAAASYYQGENGRATVEMKIVDRQGRERTRELTILRLDRGEDLQRQDFFVYFNAPADVAGTTFLVWKHPGEEDDRWLYLPALDLVRRIAVSDERTSFVGSHFFYEDVSGRSPEEDRHTLVEETDHYYILESTPKDPDAVEFKSYRNWIHKSSFIPVKTEYTNPKGEVYRRYEVLKVETIDGFSTVVQSRMSDLKKEARTTFTYRNIHYNLEMSPDIFSERFLRNPPRQHLKR